MKLCRLIQVLIYSVSMSKTNTNMNIFGLIKKGEYEYEYIRGDKKRRMRIRIWIFGLIFANTNTNTNIRHTLLHLVVIKNVLQQQFECATLSILNINKASRKKLCRYKIPRRLFGAAAGAGGLVFDEEKKLSFCWPIIFLVKVSFLIPVL